MSKKLKEELVKLSVSTNYEEAIKEWYEDEFPDMLKIPGNLKITSIEDNIMSNAYICVCGYPVKQVSLFHNELNKNVIAVSSANRRQCCIKHFPNKRDIKESNRKNFNSVPRVGTTHHAKVSSDTYNKFQKKLKNTKFVDYDNIDEGVKIILSVPYDDREEAKKYGCRWDPELKKWYCLDLDLVWQSNPYIIMKRFNFPKPVRIINGKTIDIILEDE